jgi:putative aldouronate transport system substrate-binding protein
MKKKMISILLAASMLGTTILGGCGSSTTGSAEQASKAASTETQANTEASAETASTTASAAASTTASASASTTASASDTDTWSDVDTSEEVHIVGYLLGSAPKGMDDVMTELNKKLKDKINATLEIRYLDWADYQTKYPLVLAAGEDVDFMYAADWCMYSQEANKNAFREITEADLSKYMPRHYAAQDPVAYKEGKINGKLYMISTSTPDKRCTCLAYRKDLADKYNIKNLNKLSDFTDYFKAISENEKDIAPMYFSSSYETPAFTLACEKGEEICLGADTGLCYGLEDKTIDLKPMYESPYSDAYKYGFSIMKQWYDAGYVNKDILSNTVTSRDAFVEGKSAVAMGNSIDMQSMLAAAKDKGYEVGIIPLLDAQGKTSSVSYLNNGVAIAATSQHPERTMMALDLIMEDRDFNYLAYYGIEGKNYVITADNKIALPDGVTADNNTYPPDSAGFWFTNKDQFLPMATWSDEYIDLKKKIPDMLYTNPCTAFIPNEDNIQTETANIKQVMQQYALPLEVGMVDNVDDAMATLEKNLKAAGIEDVQKEVQAQTDAYMSNQ